MLSWKQMAVAWYILENLVEKYHTVILYPCKWSVQTFVGQQDQRKGNLVLILTLTIAKEKHS